MTDEDRLRNMLQVVPTPEELKASVRKWNARLLRNSRAASSVNVVQAAALDAAERANTLGPHYGFYLQGPVGIGKTLVSQLIPLVMGNRKTLVLMRASNIEHFNRERYRWRQVFRVGDDVQAASYGQLSSVNGYELLPKLQPDLIICDEVQKVRNSDATRVRRLREYLGQRQDVAIVGMTGSITASSIMDFAPQLRLSCNEFAPIPESDTVLQNWAALLDADGVYISQESLALTLQNIARAANAATLPSISRLVKMPIEELRSLARHYFADVLERSPLVVLSRATSCSKPLYLSATNLHLGNSGRKALAALEKYEELPDGQVLVDGVEMYRAMTQLTMGFYYKAIWPGGVVDKEWKEARKAWYKAAREYLKAHRRYGLDSPVHLATAITEDKGAQAFPRIGPVYRRWASVRDRVKPASKACWVDPTAVSGAVSWAKQRERCILWFESRAVGELLNAMGLPALWSGCPVTEGHPRVALSSQVFGTGHHLVDWTEQLDMQPHARADAWEQKLGRCHRQGQDAAVRVAVNQAHDLFRGNFGAALKRARYIQEATRQPQKILLAERVGFGANANSVLDKSLQE